MIGCSRGLVTTQYEKSDLPPGGPSSQECNNSELEEEHGWCISQVEPHGLDNAQRASRDCFHGAAWAEYFLSLLD